MQRLMIVGKGIEHTLFAEDRFSGIRFGVRFKRPTAEQRVRWNSMVYRRVGDKLIINTSEANIILGRELICGIEPDCFAGPDGNPISSDKSRPDYCENWRELAVESGCLDQMAMHLAVTHFGEIRIPEEVVEVSEKNSVTTSPASGEVGATESSENDV